jgi:hypothetical protein
MQRHELTLACRTVGVKMGHAALLINHHSADTIMVATNQQKYNLTDARLQLVDFLMNKALLQDLWPAILAHYYRTLGKPDELGDTAY